RASKNFMEFGSPRPSVGEGLGVRGRARRWVLESVPRPSSRAEFRDLNQQRGIPPHPQPLSRIGARGAYPNNCDRIRTSRPSTGFAVLNGTREEGEATAA